MPRRDGERPRLILQVVETRGEQPLLPGTPEFRRALSRYHMRYPDPEHPRSWLLLSTKKGSVVRLSDQRLAAILDGNPGDDERATLNRLELWTDDPAAERAGMADIVVRTNARSRRFVATVVLTLDCNLACPYCFEDHFRGKFPMTEATARLLVLFVAREQIAHGRDVEIRFYGGEPLMAVPRLKAIARALQQAAAATIAPLTASISGTPPNASIAPISPCASAAADSSQCCATEPSTDRTAERRSTTPLWRRSSCRI